MKQIFSLLFFILLFNCFIQKLEDEETIIYRLEEEMKTRYVYQIQPNKIYKIINYSAKYIYLIELEEGLIAEDSNNQTYKQIVVLSNPNDYFLIRSQKVTVLKLYASSISNEGVEAAIIKNSNFQSFSLLFQNVIFLIHVNETEDQVISLSSFENSVLFSYWKYEYLNDTIPNSIYPINRTLLKKYNGDILFLQKNSVYVFISEIYKFDSSYNVIEIFSFLSQASKEINLELDMFYLKSSVNTYKINFSPSYFKRVLKLSKKTNNSVITLNGATILDSNNRYYPLNDEQNQNGIELKVTNDALIEILYEADAYTEILDSYSKEYYRLTKTFTVIKIPKNKCAYDIYLTGINKNKLKEFNFGFNQKVSTKNYLYTFFSVSLGYNLDKVTSVQFKTPYLYRYETDKDEYQIFEIILDQEQLNNGIYLTYNPVSYYKYLQKEMEDIRGELIIENLASMLQKYYVYQDIAKKPPEIDNLKDYHHKPIDLIKSIKSIPTKNRSFLNFYQDIYRILSSVRDGHLGIYLFQIQNIFDVTTAGFCNYFEFYVDNSSDQIVIKIRPNEECLSISPYKNKVYEFIQSHLDIPLKSINGTDPFDFIQNFGKYQTYKNRHAQFTNNIVEIKKAMIIIIPYDLSELNDIEYEFENGDIINLNFLLITGISFTDNNPKKLKEFEEFHRSLFLKKQKSLLIPDQFPAKSLFLKQQRFLLEDTSNKIEWDFQTEDGQLKCKVDNINKYNVFVQTSFSFNDFNDALNVMINCSELFYSNKYKIIGIENRNNGGTPALYEIWHQLIQQKILGKTFRSLLKTKETIDYFRNEKLYKSWTNIETCKYYSSLENMGGITDNYGMSDVFGEEIKHNRSEIYDMIDKTWRKRLESIRKINFEKKNLKNPTDILIYTDAFCFSVCSGFIKAFQNTGGAIIVGFNGNPKIEGTKEFDGSQSSSTVTEFETIEYYNLQYLGYWVSGITYAESYDDSYQLKEKAPIPREYSVDLVDRRVPIYASYSDDLYETFIKHADNIFKEFETKCSTNNKLLLLDNENCILNEHEKGGYSCGDDGEWNKSSCKAYYCDLGYYYDQFQKKCVLDPCTNIKNENNIIINDETFKKTKEYTIEPDSEMTIYLHNDKYLYFIESDTEDIITTNYESLGISNSTSLCMIDYEHTNIFDFEITINYYRKLNKSAKVKITALEKNNAIMPADNIVDDTLYVHKYMNISDGYQVMYTFQIKTKTVVFIPSFNKGVNVYYHQYNFDLTPEQIINIDTNKFKEFSNQIVNMEENKTYLFIIKYPDDIFSNTLLFAYPYYESRQSLIISNERFLYLGKQNFDYSISFQQYYKSVYIKLCEQTSDAEITILNDKTILNKNNKFYLWKNITDNLNLRLNNNNSALIEFLYEYNGVTFTNLDTKQTEFHIVKNVVYILKYKKADNITNIKFSLISNETLTLIISATYGKGNCTGAISDEYQLTKKNYTTRYLFPNEQLTDDETFDILFRVRNNATLSITLNEEEENKSGGLPAWVIALITIGVLILLIIIFIIIRHFRKNNVDDEYIEKDKLLRNIQE